MGRKRGIEVLKQSIRIGFNYQGEWCRETEYLGRKPTDKDKRYFENRRAEILSQIARGVFDYKREFPASLRAKKYASTCQTSLKHLLDQYLKAARSEVEKSTWIGYKKIINGYWIDKVGHFAVGDFTMNDLKVIIKKELTSEKTINNKLSVLRAVLDQAMDDNLITANVCNELPNISTIRKLNKKIRIFTKSRKLNAFTPTEVEALLSVMPENDRNMWQMDYWTGFRPEELIALDWQDIDFDKREIHITSTIVLNEEKDRAKTEAGNRTTSMLDGAFEALQAQHALTYFKRSKVFLNPDGVPFTGDQQLRRRAWINYFDKCGVTYRSPYHLRHSYASLMLTLGEDIEWISNQMGHTDSVLFRKTYATIIQSLQRDFGNKANEFYRNWHEETAS